MLIAVNIPIPMRKLGEINRPTETAKHLEIKADIKARFYMAMGLRDALQVLGGEGGGASKSYAVR